MYEKLLQAISQNLACQEIDGKVIMNIEWNHYKFEVVLNPRSKQ